MGPRAGISTILLLGAIVLLVAIAVGNGMGDRVLGLIPRRLPVALATPDAVPSAAVSDSVVAADWKRRRVVSVATDPAFPDPRVTPAPAPPSPTPKPTAKPTPKPAATPAVPEDSGYTSPPLPMPIVSHAPDETPQPDPEATVAEGRRSSQQSTPPGTQQTEETQQ